MLCIPVGVLFIIIKLNLDNLPDILVYNCWADTFGKKYTVFKGFSIMAVFFTVAIVIMLECIIFPHIFRVTQNFTHPGGMPLIVPKALAGGNSEIIQALGNFGKGHT